MGHGPVPDPKRQDGSLQVLSIGAIEARTTKRWGAYSKEKGGGPPNGGEREGTCGLFAPMRVSSEQAAFKGRVSCPPIDAHVDTGPERGDRAP